MAGSVKYRISVSHEAEKILDRLDRPTERRLRQVPHTCPPPRSSDRNRRHDDLPRPPIPVSIPGVEENPERAARRF
jgi:hypothetical protein